MTLEELKAAEAARDEAVRIVYIHQEELDGLWHKIRDADKSDKEGLSAAIKRYDEKNIIVRELIAKSQMAHDAYQAAADRFMREAAENAK